MCIYVCVRVCVCVYIYMYIYIKLNHFAVYLKLTHCKSIILQLKKKKKTEEENEKNGIERAFCS